MKVFKSAVAAMLLASVWSFAGIELTVDGGLNLSNMTQTEGYKLNEGVEKSMRTGFNAGVNARFAFTEQMGVVAGVSYETRGLKIDYGSEITEARSANYLQIPILFSYKVIPDLAINVGPEVGFFLGGKSEFTVYGTTIESDLKNANTLDLGLSAQVNYTIANLIVVGAGYYYGFLNADYMGQRKIDPAPKGSEKNNNIKVTVGVLISKLLGM